MSESLELYGTDVIQLVVVLVSTGVRNWGWLDRSNTITPLYMLPKEVLDSSHQEQSRAEDSIIKSVISRTVEGKIVKREGMEG